MVPPVVVAAVAQCAIYAGVMLQAGRRDYDNLAIACLFLAFVPLASAVLLVSLRRQEFPITTSAFVTVIVYNFAIAVLAALRIPVSYTGFLIAAPVAVIIVVYGIIRFRQAAPESVGILDFRNAEAIHRMLGSTAVIIKDEFVELNRYDRILIDGESHHSATWSRFLTRAYMMGVEVTPWFRYVETRLRRVDVDSFDLSHLAFSPSQIVYSKLKRFIDAIAVIAVTPVALPIAFLIWAYIRIIDGGPAIFTQERRGFGGRSFTMFKFRTMYRNDVLGAAQTATNDSRIIPGCRFLRLVRLDELPQLINILRGEMSWIGPRPVERSVAEACERLVPQYIHRHLVQPGLTGWAQVSYGYAATPEEEIQKLAYDLYYVKELSFDLDLLILIKTLQTLLLRVGAR
ncbi:MAG: sugar transferase [Alphaproteobacteria bacterium]|nr:sugar transferase [Alphaproteobacteria bacterium]